MHIRYANSNDIPRFLPLLDELGYPTSLKNFETRFRKFLSLKGYGVVICEMDDLLVGWIAWSKHNLFVSDKTRFHIEGLIVHHNQKGKGIGKKLMHFVEDIARQYSPSIIDLTSSIYRAESGSHKFYDHLGYKNVGQAKKIYLRKQL